MAVCLQTAVERTAYERDTPKINEMTILDDRWLLQKSFDVIHVIMVVLWNRADHYVFILFLPFFFFISSPNLRGRRLDVYHTFTHGVALVRI